MSSAQEGQVSRESNFLENPNTFVPWVPQDMEYGIPEAEVNNTELFRYVWQRCIGEPLYSLVVIDNQRK